MFQLQTVGTIKITIKLLELGGEREKGREGGREERREGEREGGREREREGQIFLLIVDTMQVNYQKPQFMH